MIRIPMRVRRTVAGVAKDEWDVGETHVWSGYLQNGDEAVILLNAGHHAERCQYSYHVVSYHKAA